MNCSTINDDDDKDFLFYDFASFFHQHKDDAILAYSNT